MAFDSLKHNNEDDQMAKGKNARPISKILENENEDEEEEIEVHQDAGSDEGPGSDLEDLFLDAVGEIQRASIALNAGLRGASSSRLGTTLEESYREFVDQPGGDAEKHQLSALKPDLSTEEAKVSQNDQMEEEQRVEPKERTELPWFKDPNVKVSIWAIIKDSIGKDISKLSVPVYFNDPTSLLQKCAQSMEYNQLLDQTALI